MVCVESKNQFISFRSLTPFLARFKLLSSLIINLRPILLLVGFRRVATCGWNEVENLEW
jgi:hypothetical protein